MIPRPNLEIRVRCRLVPKHAILQPIRLAAVVNHQALVILRTLIHDLTEELKGGENAGKLLKNTFPRAHLVFTQYKYVIHLATQHGRNTHNVLDRKNVEEAVVAAVHKQGSHIFITDPLIVVQAIVHTNEAAVVNRGAAAQFLLLAHLLDERVLPLQHIANNRRIELFVNKQTGYNAGVESIGAFCTADHSTNREFLFVPQQVLNQPRFAGTTAANEKDNAIVGNHSHVEF